MCELSSGLLGDAPPRECQSLRWMNCPMAGPRADVPRSIAGFVFDLVIDYADEVPMPALRPLVADVTSRHFFR